MPFAAMYLLRSQTSERFRKFAPKTAILAQIFGICGFWLENAQYCDIGDTSILNFDSLTHYFDRCAL